MTFPEQDLPEVEFSIIDVPERGGQRVAARIAVACRCAQEVRELMFDPESRGARVS